MKSVRVFVLLCCFALLAVVPAAAQTDWQCATADLSATVAAAQVQLTAAQTAIDGGDIAAALDALDEAARLAQRARPVCSGMAFGGEGDTNAVERVTLVEGVYVLEYELTAAADAMFGGIFTITYEDLGENNNMLFPVSVMASAGEVVTGSETIRVRYAGELLLDVSAAGFDNWSFAITTP